MEEVLSHPWFSDIDFDALHKKSLEPPYIPELTDDYEELVGFDKNCEELSIEDDDFASYEQL